MDTTFLNRLDQDLLKAARSMCEDAAENAEYVRGIAEFLIDTSGDAGLTMDEHRDDLMAWLGAPPAVPLRTDDAAHREAVAFTKLAIEHPELGDNAYYLQAFVIAKDGSPTSVWRWDDEEFHEITLTDLVGEWLATGAAELPPFITGQEA